MRKFLTFLIIATLYFGSFAADRPNIMIILTDDMGFSDLGCYGGEIATPNLDKLAEKGLRFTNFYNTSRCWPTRATLMNGIYTDQLIKDVPTLPELLKKAGYQTAMVGKWHLSPNPTDVNSPTNRGFDDFYGTINGAGSFWDPATLTRNKEYVQPDGENFYYTDKIGAEAVRQIEQFAKIDKPFFHYVAFTAAHWPLHAPEKTIQKYLPMYKDGWEVLRQNRYKKMLEMGIIDEKNWRLLPFEADSWEKTPNKEWQIRNMAIYAAMVDHMDQAVGKIIESLKKNNLFDNTLIIYFHDNGACRETLKKDAFGTAKNVLEKAKNENRVIAVGDVYSVMMGGPDTYGSVGKNWAHAQNTPLRLYKANALEGGIKTPAIMHWPKGIKNPGTITAQRGHIIDCLATSLELANLNYTEWSTVYKEHPLESQSLCNILKGGEVSNERHYLFNHGGQHAVIKGEYKIVRFDLNAPWQLYSLTQDQTETQNLAKENPEKVKELSQIWEARYGGK